MAVVEWALSNWFQILLLFILTALVSALIGVSQTIAAASNVLAIKIDQFQAALCREADEHAWADEGHRYSFADRLIANIQSLEKTLRVERPK